MSKFIDAEEITPIMAKYVADVFSRKEHLDDISYGYCMEIADVFRRYAERAEQEQPKKSQKSCNDCPHCVDRKDQFGWHFKGCFGGPYKGKFIAEIDECPLYQQPELPGIEDPGIPGKDFIPVEWVDACEMYEKWKIVKQEQPSFPDNLDEAAEEYLKYHKLETASIRKLSMYRSLAFKAGAEWMAGKGYTVDGIVICDKELTRGYKDIVMSIPDELKVDDEVTIQIRKREEK